MEIQESIHCVLKQEIKVGSVSKICTYTLGTTELSEGMLNAEAEIGKWTAIAHVSRHTLLEKQYRFN